MIIKNAKFIISAVGPKQYPEEGLPEIALCGRSNVGKSSLINKFINRKNLARTSGQPGKTQTMNYYHITSEPDFYFVDLPGYGFAKVSRSLKAQWAKFIEEYLLKREHLKGVMQLLDLRHPPSKEDLEMYEWLRYQNADLLVVTTKCDKISKGQRLKHLNVIRQALGAPPEQKFIVFSAETGEGLEELHQWVEMHVLS